MGEDGKKVALEYTAQLRRAGIEAILATGNRSLKAQMRQANAAGAANVLIVGGDELKEGKLVWRDMSKGDQNVVSFAEVLQRLKQGV
jgi:histidyl-tRNA synthetase